MECVYSDTPHWAWNLQSNSGTQVDQLSSLTTTVQSYSLPIRRCCRKAGHARGVLPRASLLDHLAHSRGNGGSMDGDSSAMDVPSPFGSLGANVGPYRTPSAGLYLCGASTHPRGNIIGLPGYNAASVIADDIGLPKWRHPADPQVSWAAL
jgi:phytoene dehydrogenase-like protein